MIEIKPTDCCALYHLHDVRNGSSKKEIEATLGAVEGTEAFIITTPEEGRLARRLRALKFSKVRVFDRGSREDGKPCELGRDCPACYPNGKRKKVKREKLTMWMKHLA